MGSERLDQLRKLLCELGTAVQTFVIEQRRGLDAAELSEVSSISQSDTIYAIDRLSYISSRVPSIGSMITL